MPPLNWHEILMIALPIVIGGILNFAHTRGRRMPILEKIFDWINNTKPPVQPSPSSPADESSNPPRFPILNAILQAMSGGNKINFTHDPDTGKQSLYVEPKASRAGGVSPLSPAIAAVALGLCASFAFAQPHPCGSRPQRVVERSKRVELRPPCDNGQCADPKPSPPAASDAPASVPSVALVPFFSRSREVSRQFCCPCGPRCRCNPCLCSPVDESQPNRPRSFFRSVNRVHAR